MNGRSSMLYAYILLTTLAFGVYVYFFNIQFLFCLSGVYGRFVNEKMIVLCMILVINEINILICGIIPCFKRDYMR